MAKKKFDFTGVDAWEAIKNQGEYNQFRGDIRSGKALDDALLGIGDEELKSFGEGFLASQKKNLESSTGNAVDDLGKSDTKSIGDSLKLDTVANTELQNYEVELQEQVKKEKLAPATDIEQGVLDKFGGEDSKEYEKYKSEKEELDALNAKTLIGKYRKQTAEYKKYLPDDKQAEKAWYLKTLKSITDVTAPLVGAVHGISETLIDNITGENVLSKKEEERRAYLENKINNLEKPVKQQYLKDIEKKELDTYKTFGFNSKEEIQHAKVNHDTPYWKKRRAEGADDETIYNEIDQLEDISAVYNKNKNLIKSGIDNAGIIDGFLFKDLDEKVTLGLAGVGGAAKMLSITDKAKSGQELTAFEKAYADAHLSKVETEGKGLNNNSWNELGDSVAHSLVFMGEMALTGGAVGTLTKGSRLALQAGKSGFKNSVLKGMLSASEYVAGAALQPSTHLMAADKYTESLQSVENQEDSQGNDYLVSDGEKINYVKNTKSTLASLDLAIKRKTQELYDAIEADPEADYSGGFLEIDKMQADRDKLTRNLNKLIDEDGKLLKPYISKTEAIGYGLHSNVIEGVSEKFVGSKLDKGFSKLGNAVKNSKVVGALAKNKIASKAGKGLSGLNDQLAKGRVYLDDVITSTKVGNLTKSYYQHIGPAKMVHSLPSEMMEEVFVQLNPVLTEDYAQKLEELMDTDFYTQVALSTLMIGGITQVSSAAVQGTRYSLDSKYRGEVKEHRANVREAREVYKRLNEARIDEQVAKEVTMNTMGTIFQQNEYQEKIDNLLNENVPDPLNRSMEERKEAAKRLEKTSLYNMAHQASLMGTEKEFKRAMNSLMNKIGISDETKSYAQKAIEEVDSLKDLKEEYRDKLNGSQIIDYNIRKRLLEETRNALLEKADDDSKAQYEKEIEEFNKKHGYEDGQFDIINTTVEDFNNDPDLQKYAMSFQAQASDTSAQYVYNLFNANVAQEDINELQKKIDYETDPKNELEIYKREEARRKEYLKLITNAQNAQKLKEKFAKDSKNAGMLNYFVNSWAIQDSTQVVEKPKEEIPEEKTAPTIIPTENLGEIVSTINQFTPPVVEEVKEEVEEQQSSASVPPTGGSSDGMGGLQKKGKSNGDGSSTPPPPAPPKGEKKKRDLSGFSNGNVTDDEITDPAVRARLEAIRNGDYAPLPRNPKDASQNDFVDSLTGSFKSMLQKHPGVDLDSVITSLRSALGSGRQVEQNFEMITEAFEKATGKPLSQAVKDSVYNNHFPKAENFVDLTIFGNTSDTSGTVTQNVPTATTLNKEGTVVETKTDEQTGIKQEVKYALNTSGIRKYSGVGLKFGGILGRNYVSSRRGVKNDTSDYVINEEAKPYMDWRNFHEGAEIEMVFNFDYALDPNSSTSAWTDIDSLGTDDDNSARRIKMTMRERLFEGNEEEGIEPIFKDHPTIKTWEDYVNSLQDYIDNPKSSTFLKDNLELLKVMPIGTINKGYLGSEQENNDNPILNGGLNDYDWFNNSNVALKLFENGEPDFEEREKRIEENKKINLAARLAIVNNGSFKTNFTEYREGATNKLPLVTEKEIEQGYPDTFQSVISQFDDNIEEFEKNAGIAFLSSTFNLIGSNPNDDRDGLPLEINGEVVKREDIANWESFVESIIDSGHTNGRTVLVHKAGIKPDGKPIFKIINVITNHSRKQKGYKKAADFIDSLFYELIENDSDTPEKIKAKAELRDFFESKFGYPFTQETKDLISYAYPHILEKASEDDYRSDFVAVALNLDTIPDITPYLGNKGIKDFLNDLKNLGDMPTTTPKEMMLRGIHTNNVFTKITKNGENIYTSSAQPVGMLSSTGLDTDIEITPKSTNTTINQQEGTGIESPLKELERHIDRLEKKIAFSKESLLNETDEEAIKVTKEEITTLEKILSEAINERNNLTGAIGKGQGDGSGKPEVEQDATKQENIKNFLDNNSELNDIVSEEFKSETEESFEENFNSYMENFVNLNFDNLVQNLESLGLVEKECN